MLLVIDNATPACSVALVDGEQIIAERCDLVGRGHAEKLLPMIEALLGSRRPRAIVVDCGPGSFTGVRVGLAAAHGLAIGWDVPLAGYSSLALLAARVQETEMASALQAGHGQLFVQSFAGDPMAPLDALRALAPADAAQAISAELVIGNGAQSLVEARGYGRAIDALPRASEVWLLPPSLRNLPPRPIYGRAPDAKPMP
jgi:tRNA threonylcarbamoyladenosine biosynthesis protein TsaB